LTDFDPDSKLQLEEHVFRRSQEQVPEAEIPDRVDSVLGRGLTWQGEISGMGGIRIDGAFDGEIRLRGLVVVGESGRVTCEQIRAARVIVAGSVKGDINAYKVEIAQTGRVWGDVTTTSFSTEEGAFLRGQITMEDELDLGFSQLPDEAGVETPDDSQESSSNE
jgi:cytoskeletal protein CcmA (bactofilin family)